MTVIYAHFGGATNDSEARALLKAGRKRASQYKKAAKLAYQRDRHLRKTNQTPAWACRDAILAIYVECARISLETGVPHEVDHIVPLTHHLVTGLHCEANLRIVTRAENRRKCNAFKIA